jgi:hypothetical protein
MRCAVGRELFCVIDSPVDQYALLRASEEALGIQTFLGKAATANDMRAGMHF